MLYVHTYAFVSCIAERPFMNNYPNLNGQQRLAHIKQRLLLCKEQ